MKRISTYSSGRGVVGMVRAAAWILEGIRSSNLAAREKLAHHWLVST